MGKKKVEVQLSEEELEEEAQFNAAIVIQCAYRCKLAREKRQDLVRQLYVKIIDRDTKLVFYKNRNTGEVSREKPRALKHIDLPTPRTFACPNNYDPGPSDGLGYALLVTVSSFTNPKMKPLPKVVDADHGMLEHVLSHDFICKFRGENVITLRNPSKQSFIESLMRLKQMCKIKSFLFVYICTHVVTIKSKAHKDENCFFCFKDTIWNDSESAARTSLPLIELSKLINAICSEKKVFALNIAHTRPIEKSIFKSRYMYPPPDSLTRLADLCKCCVLGSCNIGTAFQDMQDHSPNNRLHSARRGALRVEAGVEGHVNREHAIHHGSKEDSKHVQKVMAHAKREFEASELNYFQSQLIKKSFISRRLENDPMPQLPVMTWTKIQPPAITDEKIPKSNAVGESKADENENNEEEKKEEEENEDGKEGGGEKATKKMPTRIVENLPPLQLSLPTPQEITRYKIKLASWKLRRQLDPMISFVHDNYERYKETKSVAPMQWGKLLERYSVFGQAIHDGLSSQVKKPKTAGVYITAEVLFDYIREAMSLIAERYMLELEKSLVDAEVKDKMIAEENHDQHPVFFIPRDSPHADQVHYPVCSYCGPPAAPEAPYVIKCTPSTVLIEWTLPVFDGVPASKFRIYMRNNCRLMFNWTVVPGADSVKATFGKWDTHRYLVCHLPTGVPVEFAVAGHNNGGWSVLSKSTVEAIPGEELIPQTMHGQWRRLARGGPLAVLDRLEEYASYRHEVIMGFRELIAFAQKEGTGFTRSAIREKCCNIVLKTLKMFPMDEKVAAPGFTLLGYSIQGKNQTKLRIACKQAGLIDEIKFYIKHFRSSTEIIAALQWLKRVLPKDFPELGEYKKIFIDGTGVNEEEENKHAY